MDRRILAYSLIVVALLALALFTAAPGALRSSRAAATATSAAAPALLPSAYPPAALAAPPSYPAAPTYAPIPSAAAPQATSAQASAPTYGYRVVQSYPHDRTAFTEGLVYTDGVLYEGTGEKGKSELRRVDLASGTVALSVSLDSQYFGEGVAVMGDKIYQLTWQEHQGFIYDKTSFAKIGEWQYPSEGWGLSHDGSRLIMSDGTATIRFLDPATLSETGRIEVRDGSTPIVNINELEYIKGQIFANIWQTDRVARIDPASGQVTAWIDLSGLLTPEERALPGTDVLNGIAYDAEGDRLFVTGKRWPKLFQIELVPPQASTWRNTALPLICRSA